MTCQGIDKLSSILSLLINDMLEMCLLFPGAGYDSILKEFENIGGKLHMNKAVWGNYYDLTIDFSKFDLKS